MTYPRRPLPAFQIGRYVVGGWRPIAHVEGGLGDDFFVEYWANESIIYGPGVPGCAEALQERFDAGPLDAVGFAPVAGVYLSDPSRGWNSQPVAGSPLGWGTESLCDDLNVEVRCVVAYWENSSEVFLPVLFRDACPTVRVCPPALPDLCCEAAA